MTIQEILKAQGIEDKTVQAILDEMKANKVYTASEENLDIRYGKLKEQHEGTDKQLKEALAAIEQYKQASGDAESLQAKLTSAVTENAQLKAQLAMAQMEGEAQVQLLSEGANPDDMDYLLFKLKAMGDMKQDEHGKVKDLGDKIAALKTKLPGQFPAKKKTVLENTLPEGKERENEPSSLEEALKMAYDRPE